MKRRSSKWVTVSPHRGVEQSPLERTRLTLSMLGVWTERELRSRYRQSFLRTGWLLLQPVLLLATYGWVMTAVLDVRSDDVPYLTFAWCGVVPYTLFSQALGQGVGSIIAEAATITKVWFPRDVIPLSVVASSAVDFSVMFGILIAITWIQVGRPTIHLIGVLAPLALLVVWTIAGVLLSSAVTVFRRDLAHVMPVILRVAFILSPVVYPASLLIRQSQLLIDLNPLAVSIEGFRAVVYERAWPNWSLLAAHLVAGMIALVAASVVFRHLEPRMSDVV